MRRVPACIDPAATGCEGRDIRSTPPPVRADVSCDLAFEVEEHASLALQIGVAQTAGTPDSEEFVASLDGRPLAHDQYLTDDGGRVHTVTSGPGNLTIGYRALLPIDPSPPRPATPGATLVALRQSRYCPSDRLEGFVASEFAELAEGPDRAHAVADWVFERLRYELGSTGTRDSAIDTLLTGEGVCRDFAHLTIALCRAIGVPARLVSVYAPGLSPMDFHAVTEVAVDGAWQVLDATRLAPRPTLVRIATGRDAADTAFCVTTDGSAELVMANIGASTDSDLPLDDHRAVVSLA